MKVLCATMWRNEGEEKVVVVVTPNSQLAWLTWTSAQRQKIGEMRNEMNDASSSAQV